MKYENIEIIEVWKKNLADKFIDTVPENENLIEKTKIIKRNISETLDVALKVASLAGEKKIFETSQSQKSIQGLLDKIQKDIVSIAVFGQMSSGKSSFINALVGEELLAVKQSRATAIITVIRHIDNFKGSKDGDVEIHYKSEQEILAKIDYCLDQLENYTDKNYFENFTNLQSTESIDSESLKSKLDNIQLDEIIGKDKKTVRALKNIVIVIVEELNSNSENLGKVLKKSSFNKDFLTQTGKSAFINKVIFYKDIKLLKNIELIDTPGLGSNRLEDTQLSEAYLSSVDVIMILTDAKEPMQKDTEEDIATILQDVQKSTDDESFFDKVFIILNKVDTSELNRKEIKKLLNDSLEEIGMEHIQNENKMFVSAFYEYQKKFNPKGLDGLHIENIDNITDDDLNYIEKKIYTFTAKESTSKFLNENINKIEETFQSAEKNFQNNISKLEEDIKITSKKIEKFEMNKKGIKIELQKELKTIIIDQYRKLLADSMEYTEKILFGSWRTTGDGTEKYAYEKAMKNKIFLKATNDNSSSNHYVTLGKFFLNVLIKETSEKIQNKINNNILNKKVLEDIEKELQEKTQSIQTQYENEYGVNLELPNIEISNISINLSEDIDLRRGYFREIVDFFRLFAWGKEKKYAETTAKEWERYVKRKSDKKLEGGYSEKIHSEIKNKFKNSQKEIEKTIDDEISNIVSTIEKQLNQELNDKQQKEGEKKSLESNKKSIKDTFKYLDNTYIAATKKQNQELFQ